MRTRMLPSEHEVPQLVPGPGSVTWRRATDARTFLAAGYALLLQVAHPTVGAGVRDHSDYREDPWGRLLRTLDFTNALIYAEPPLAAAVARGVRARHRRIRGLREDGSRERFPSKGTEVVLPPQPIGRHRLLNEDRPDQVCHLIVAPDRCYLPPLLLDGERRFGIAAHLYSLRSRGDQGIGDFTTLRRLAAVAAGVCYIALGLCAGFAAVLIAASPPLLIQAVAGLALLGSRAAALGMAGGTERDGIAFNLADVFTIVGLFGLIGSVCVVLVVHRERLIPPRAWERALWQKLSRR